MIGKLEMEEEKISQLINTYYLKFALRSFESKKIHDCFDIKIGRTPPRKEAEWFSKSTKDFTWFSIKDFGSHKVFTGESNEYLTKEAIAKFHVPLLNKDTVLMSFKLTVGKTLLANKDCVCTNEAIASFIPKKGYEKYNYYLYSFLLNQHFENAGSTSSIATAINSKIIKNYKLETPSLQDIENYNQIVIPLFELTKITRDQIKILRALKNSYLKLFF